MKIVDRSKRKPIKGSNSGKEPSHGGGRRFESGRGHRSFWDLEEAAVSIEFQDSGCKLSTSSEKLSTPPVDGHAIISNIIT